MGTSLRFALLLGATFMLFLCLMDRGEAKTSSCVTCHTDDQALKTLYRPPKAVVSEEGEG